MNSIGFRHIDGAAMVAKTGKTTTNLRLPPGFLGRHVVLQRFVWEHVGIASVSYSGVQIPYALRQVGEDKVLDLPLSDTDRTRILSIDWAAIGNRSFHLHYKVTEEPVEGGAPETMRAPSDELVERRPVDTSPPTELEEAIAGSFRVPVLRFREIVRKLAENSGLEREALLEFFGHDGFTTIEPETIELITKRAQELELDPAELLVAQTFRGVAQAVGEKTEFDRLMADKGTAPAKPSGEDFKVSSAVMPGEAATAAGVPNVTLGGRINELARWFNVSPSWLVLTVSSISDLRGVKASEVVNLMTRPMVTALRQMFLSVVSAPDEPAVKAASETVEGEPPAERIILINQGIATRSIDSVAAAKAQAPV